MDETPPDWLFEDYEWDSTALTARLSEGPSSGPSSAMEVQGPSSSGKLATASRATCRVAGCDRYPEKPYYKKYRICIRHAKSPAVVIDGVGQRFCQKCGRFHDLSAFSPGRRSCRVRLEEHNRRRREMQQQALHTAQVVPKGGDARRRRKSEDAVEFLPASEPLLIKTESSPSMHASGSDDFVLGSLSHSAPHRLLPTPAVSEEIGPARAVDAAAASIVLIPGAASGWDAATQTLDAALQPTGAQALQPIGAQACAGAHAFDARLPQLNHPGSAHLGAPGAAPLPGASPCGMFTAVPPDQLSIALPPLVPGADSAAPLYPAGYAPRGVNADATARQPLWLAPPPFAGAAWEPPVLHAPPVLPVPPPAGPHEDDYVPPERVVRLAFKVFGATPAQLPPELRPEIEKVLRANPDILQGYVRPGCTHLTLDVRLLEEDAARVEATLVEDLVAEVMAQRSLGAAAQERLLAQAGARVAVARDGRVVGVVALQGGAAPELDAVRPSCVAVEAGGACHLDLAGRNIGRGGDLVMCRQDGKFLTVDMLNDEEWALVDASSGDEEDGQEDQAPGAIPAIVAAAPPKTAPSAEASPGSDAGGKDAGKPAATVRRSVTLPVQVLGLRCGCVEVEVQCGGGVLTQARPLLVLPDAAAAAEVRALMAGAEAIGPSSLAAMEAFLRDAGVVIGHLHGGQRSARKQLVASIAQRAAAYALRRGCTALSLLLLPGALVAGSSAQEVATALWALWQDSRPCGTSVEAVDRWVAMHASSAAAASAAGDCSAAQAADVAAMGASPWRRSRKAGMDDGAGVSSRSSSKKLGYVGEGPGEDACAAMRTQAMEWQVRLRGDGLFCQTDLGRGWAAGQWVAAALIVVLACGAAALLARAQGPLAAL